MTETEITNEMVAEQVMGWTQRPVGRGRHLKWFNADGDGQELFYPLDDAGDDYLVFDRVRDQIDERNSRFMNFYEYLSDVLQSNPDSGPANPDCDHLYLMHYYRVGDYSRAAMAAIQKEAA